MEPTQRKTKLRERESEAVASLVLGSGHPGADLPGLLRRVGPRRPGGFGGGGGGLVGGLLASAELGFCHLEPNESRKSGDSGRGPAGELPLGSDTG